jgi:hypothetical protein
MSIALCLTTKRTKDTKDSNNFLTFVLFAPFLMKFLLTHRATLITI